MISQFISKAFADWSVPQVFGALTLLPRFASALLLLDVLVILLWLVSRRTFKDNSKRFRKLTRMSSDWYWELDREFRFTLSIWHSSAEFDLIGATNLLGKSIWELPDFAEVTPDKWREHQTTLKAHRPFKDFAVQFPGRDRPPSTISINGEPIFAPDGSFTGYLGVGRDISEWVKAEQQILTLNATLEQRVKERTVALEAVVNELEAFSYSVSHDLRAPLRSIEGFTRAIEQKYSGRMDDSGKGYLARIRRNSVRMDELINDMLALSRITQGDFIRADVDISELANSIITELRHTDPDREVAVTVDAGILVQGDYRLLKLALENLIGNAWKFTSKCENARIFVHVEETNHGCATVIRDNGAGFDMRYANKLFGAFQRLHSVTEFEGTGIGLAIVQRVIKRHGGKVWAEGEIGKGAAVYLVLQQDRGQDRQIDGTGI